MDEINELIWEHNREMALQALETFSVDNYTTQWEKTQQRALYAP